MRVALFGGSFDPPHLGHQLCVLYALETEPVDALWVVPVFEHAFGKPLTDYGHRLQMCRRMIQPFDGRVSISEVESELGGVSHTVDTVRHLVAQDPSLELAIVVGADVLGELSSWHESEALQQMVRFVVIGRRGYESDRVLALPEVSSTDVRRRLAAGSPCGHLVPRSVLDYIEEHDLYRSGPVR